MSMLEKHFKDLKHNMVRVRPFCNFLHDVTCDINIQQLDFGPTLLLPSQPTT